MNGLHIRERCAGSDPLLWSFFPISLLSDDLDDNHDKSRRGYIGVKYDLDTYTALDVHLTLAFQSILFSFSRGLVPRDCTHAGGLEAPLSDYQHTS